MPNYANSKVYKLVCTLPGVDDIYVGATTYARLQTRLSCHRCEAKALKWNFRLYEFMRKHGIGNFAIELIEPWPCASRKELGVREQHWIDELKPSLNAMPATSHRKEVLRRYNNKPERKAYMRAYHEAQKRKKLKSKNVELI